MTGLRSKFERLGWRHLALALALMAFAVIAVKTRASSNAAGEAGLSKPPSHYLTAPLDDLAPLLEWTERQLKAKEASASPFNAAQRGAIKALQTRLALLRGRPDEALRLIAQARSDSAKLALRPGLLWVEELLAATQQDSAGGAWLEARWDAELQQRLKAQSWPAAQAGLQALVSTWHFMPIEHRVISWTHSFDTFKPGNPTRPDDLALAEMIINFRFEHELLGPRVAGFEQGITRFLAAQPAGEDFWAARAFKLPEGQGQAVRVAVWETVGVDVMAFKHAERPCLMLTDKANQFCIVDPVLPGLNRHEAWLLVKGFEDSTQGRKSAAAAAYSAHLEQVRHQHSSDQVAYAQAMAQMTTQLLEGVSRLHGTHVAGIAMAGNPHAELLAIHSGSEFFKPAFIAKRGALQKQLEQIAAFIRDNKVRIVNMSWGLPGIGMQAEQERALREQMLALMAACPNTLFVAGAGNENSDMGPAASRFWPASLGAANLLAVGALDHAGHVTGFSNYGEAVHLYALGDATLSAIPGEQTMAMSGTSMAAPEVSNLAAKLLSQWPGLTVAQLKQLLIDGADPVAPGTQLPMAMRRLNPLHSAQLARKPPGELAKP
ncbi:S8 family serine peptidase [Roseateles albus]|uniref:S8 family serine peptidase n=1 Tax=Roseateles albus TaxID=2987525 RepID=A0ABT5K8V7_9BURK|nr:S8 family serine peptidase [Roseateles albus]MDC8770029.1 S8 family serine peptidase [Roseateles albus]